MFAEVLAYARDFAASRYLRAGSARPTAWRRLRSVCTQAMNDARPGSSLQLAAARGRVSCAAPDEMRIG